MGIREWFEWFQRSDIEASQEQPPVVQPPTDADDCVILRPNFDFRRDDENV